MYTMTWFESLVLILPAIAGWLALAVAADGPGGPARAPARVRGSARGSPGLTRSGPATGVACPFRPGARQPTRGPGAVLCQSEF